MSNFSLFAATDLLTDIAAAMDSGDNDRAADLASVGMNNADNLLCRIEDGAAPEFKAREQEIATQWDNLYTARIAAQGC